MQQGIVNSKLFDLLKSCSQGRDSSQSIPPDLDALLTPDEFAARAQLSRRQAIAAELERRHLPGASVVEWRFHPRTILANMLRL